MKLLKTEDNLGFYLCKSGNFDPIDKITKEDLLRLVDLTLQQEVEFDEYDENTIKNEAHRIVYKNIVEKLQTLQERKQEFCRSIRTIISSRLREISRRFLSTKR